MEIPSVFLNYSPEGEPILGSEADMPDKGLCLDSSPIRGRSMGIKGQLKGVEEFESLHFGKLQV